MAIPVYLQQFKAAGVYRVVFDKSTMLSVNSSILRLVVGYSEQGPFNIPTLVNSVAEFKALYGDTSRKLEKRGDWFHRLAQQALATGPILALNIKKFDGEAVGAATISTEFDSQFETVDEQHVLVEDIYNTERFWELDAEKLPGMDTVSGSKLDQYINISTTDTKKKSATVFIRKATGPVVSGYNITLNDWYSDETDALPEYLENYRSTLVSDYMAEIYVFKGKFTKEQVLASSSLKKHFTVVNNELVLNSYELNAFGEPVDTLQALYEDETSGALGHYVGSLIPYMRNKRGQYISLDILFNSDQYIHNLMMAFNLDMLDEEDNSGELINISGKNHINTKMVNEIWENKCNLKHVLGNTSIPVTGNKIGYSNNIEDDNNTKFYAGDRYISGLMYVSGLDDTNYSVSLTDWKDESQTIKLQSTKEEWDSFKTAFAQKNVLGIEYITDERGKIKPDSIEFDSSAIDKEGRLNAAKYVGHTVITAIKKIEKVEDDTYVISDISKALYTKAILTTLVPESIGAAEGTLIYDAAVSFVSCENDNWNNNTDPSIFETETDDDTLTSVFSVGDACVGKEGDNAKGEVFVTAIDEYPHGAYYKNGDKRITALEFKNLTDEEKAEFEPITYKKITFSGTPYMRDTNYLIRINADICQENGNLTPIYFEGYTYGYDYRYGTSEKEYKEHPNHNDTPAGTDMYSKLKWQESILSVLTDYTGLRTGLLNKSDIDYRYIVDTFESYVDSGVKKVLSFLAKEKQSAFAILNFPSVKTFVKCPYSSYVNDKGIFNVQYVVDGYNKKKTHSVAFSLPTDEEGASFCAFYTPLKFSDGYIDSIVPSAGLVSNLFLNKYLSRKPYYIIAGPNYGAITASGLVGPDYNYSKDELQIIEPFGVNCMVYRPSFGTFINANQTAKQTPVSALSRVNVRELVIYLQDEIEHVLQQYQWEFNTPGTRSAILARANDICANIQANGGIQAYKNVMDESNNTPEIIDNEMAVLSTFIEPGFGCGKMVQELTIYKTGQLKSAISE